MKAEWHILTVTEGGTVSLLKNLTEEVARKTMQRLRPRFDSGNPWDYSELDAKARQHIANEAEATRREQQMRENGYATFALDRTYTYPTSSGDLKRVECFGPEGKTLIVWPKPDDWDERFAAAVAQARSALATA